VINQIVSCGCSWMYGSGCHKNLDHRVSALFAKKYNAEDINMAKDGGNNDRSVRKIVDWVVQNKDKLDETIFLLGLSNPERYDLWDEVRGCYAGGCYEEDRPDDLDISNEGWRNGWTLDMGNDHHMMISGRTERLMGKYHWNTLRDYDRTFRNVIYIIGVLDSLNCKYLIFDCLGWTRPNLPSKEDYVWNSSSSNNDWKYEDYTKLLRYVIDNPLYQEILTHKNFYSKQCWMEFCLPRGKGLLAAEAEQNPDEQTPYPADGNLDWGHPSSKSNKLWFEVLINYIDKNKLW